MIEITLQRLFQVNGATLGVLHGLPFTIYTLENEWKDNQRNISCIPSGEYDCIAHGWEEDSPVRFKKTWELNNVPDRSAILIHAGNFPEDTKGCILVGTGMKVDQSISQVTESRKALRTLQEYLGTRPFKIIIKGFN
jgi:hypothetical protein